MLILKNDLVKYKKLPEIWGIGGNVVILRSF